LKTVQQTAATQDDLNVAGLQGFAWLKESYRNYDAENPACKSADL